MQEPFWVPKEAVLALHDRQLAEHGGLSGVRDMGLLESALARPQNLFYYGNDSADPAALAASYAYGLATNHPYIDGNKRMALVVSITFLRLNGQNIATTREEAYLVFMKLAAGTLSEDDMSAWFRQNIVSL